MDSSKVSTATGFFTLSINQKQEAGSVETKSLKFFKLSITLEKSTEEPGFIFDSFIYRIIKNQI